MKFVAVVFLLAVASVNSQTIIESFDSDFETEIASSLVTEFEMQVDDVVTRLAATMVRVRDYQKQVFNRLDSILTVPRAISGEFARIRKYLRNQITSAKVGEAYTKAYNDFHDTIRARILTFNNQQTSDSSETCWIQADVKTELANSYFFASSELGSILENLSASLNVIETRIDADLIKYKAIFSDKKFKWKEIAQEFNQKRNEIINSFEDIVRDVIAERNLVFKSTITVLTDSKATCNGLVDTLFSCYT